VRLETLGTREKNGELKKEEIEGRKEREEMTVSEAGIRKADEEGGGEEENKQTNKQTYL
jgi:hypothetical protein